MTRFSANVLFGFVVLNFVGCGRREAPPAQDSHAEAPASPETAVNPNEVKVEEGMLRDLRITTAAVESRSGSDQVTLLGELAVDERTYAEVGTPVSARVLQLFAAPGDQVRQGQALVELQSPEVGRARADYQTAQSRLALAEQTLRRKRELAAERIAPTREVQEAEAESHAAQAEVRAAAAALSAVGLPTPAGPDADHSSVFRVASPVAGTVIERRAMRGQMLDPSATAFRIANLSTLWLNVHAFERDAVRVRRGTAARVTFSALPGQDFTGAVTLVGRQVSSDSRTVDVRIDVRNQGDLLRPGMSASATLPIGASDTPVIAVPVAAVQRVGEAWCVFLPKSAGTFEIRKIGRGRDLGGEVEVLSGLVVGETVVVDGAFLLKAQAEKRNAGHGHH